MTANNSTSLTDKAVLDLLEQLMEISSVKVELLTELQRRIPASDTDESSEQEAGRDALKGILTDAIIMLNRTSSKDMALIKELKSKIRHSNIGSIQLDLKKTDLIISKIREIIKS